MTNNPFQFDQYSRLAIRLNIFSFLVINLKKNLKLEKSSPLVCRAHRHKSNDVATSTTHCNLINIPALLFI